jgi:hypothetical protein
VIIYNFEISTATITLKDPSIFGSFPVNHLVFIAIDTLIVSLGLKVVRGFRNVYGLHDKKVMV